jgi:hypothetical protein
MTMRTTITPEEAAELMQLWREYWEASALALEIMRTEGTEGEVVPRIVAADKRAGVAMARIKEIYGEV